MKLIMLAIALSISSFAQSSANSSFEKGFEYGRKSCEKKYCLCQYGYGQYPANFQPVVVIKGQAYPLAPAMGEYRCNQKLMEVSVCNE